jgi:hypothetical protein
VNHGEIARVQLRKVEQRLHDVERELTERLGELVRPDLLRTVLAEILTESWVAGRGYEVAEETPEHVTLRSDQVGQPTLRMQFLGRTPVGRYGTGFAAELYQLEGGEWIHVAGIDDWGGEPIDLVDDD